MLVVRALKISQLIRRCRTVRLLFMTRCTRSMRRVSIAIAVLATFFLAGCVEDQFTAQQAVLAQSIAAEQPGDYFIGRRLYRRNYFFWGYVRKPQQPWSQAQLVMVNEQKALMPDRAANAMGSDNNLF
jgi:hypothetical protein